MNEDFDREVIVTGRLVEGTIPASASFVVVWEGRREPLIPEDENDVFMTVDGQPFGVIK